jgi:hypothetical protein
MFENVAKGSIPIFGQKSFYLRTQAPLTTKKMPIFKKNFQVVTGAFIHIKQKISNKLNTNKNKNIWTLVIKQYSILFLSVVLLHSKMIHRQGGMGGIGKLT